MRRITIAAVVGALAAVGAAPAAADTATFSGTCSITGVSTFDPPLTGTTQTIKYDFRSGSPAEGVADSTKCSGTLNGKQITDEPMVAAVAGEGNLSCDMGASTTPGKGSLTFPDGSVFTFDFEFSALLTEVDFTATYGSGTKATGHASFLTYAPPTTVFDCSPAGSGIKALGFDATTDEASAPLEGTRPTAGGGNEGGGDQTSTPPAGDQKPSAKERRKACMKKANKKKNKKKRKKAKKRCSKIK